MSFFIGSPWLFLSLYNDMCHLKQVYKLVLSLWAWVFGQTVVFCLVEIYIVLGKAFVPYLGSLSSTQLRLVTIYANRISQVLLLGTCFVASANNLHPLNYFKLCRNLIFVSIQSPGANLTPESVVLWQLGTT